MGTCVPGQNRHCLCAVVAAGAALFPLGDEAAAQTVFTTIQAFGDSYADTGNLFKILGTPNPVQYPTGRFSGGTNFVDTTSALLGIPQNNFAIGGAKTGHRPTSSVRAFPASRRSGRASSPRARRFRRPISSKSASAATMPGNIIRPAARWPAFPRPPPIAPPRRWPASMRWSAPVRAISFSRPAMSANCRKRPAIPAASIGTAYQPELQRPDAGGAGRHRALRRPRRTGRRLAARKPDQGEPVALRRRQCRRLSAGLHRKSGAAEPVSCSISTAST